MNYKSVVNTYPANKLKQYVESQNVMSYHYAVIDARFNVKSEDHRDPTVHRVTVDTITSCDVTCSDVTPVKVVKSGVKSWGIESCTICHAEQG